MKKLLIAAMVAGSLGTGFTLPSANAAVVVVREAPPPPRDERVPEARRGHVWAPGHYEYRNHHYVWTRGHWVRERRGYVYNTPTWHERDGRWVQQRGGWARGHRDNDGDGVPNREDARPNNPNRS
ncbi:MAG: YXWGXW repeat-containing protein [Massilia sp.]